MGLLCSYYVAGLSLGFAAKSISPQARKFNFFIRTSVGDVLYYVVVLVPYIYIRAATIYFPPDFLGTNVVQNDGL